MAALTELAKINPPKVAGAHNDTNISKEDSKEDSQEEIKTNTLNIDTIQISKSVTMEARISHIIAQSQTNELKDVLEVAKKADEDHIVLHFALIYIKETKDYSMSKCLVNGKEIQMASFCYFVFKKGLQKGKIVRLVYPPNDWDLETVEIVWKNGTRFEMSAKDWKANNVSHIADIDEQKYFETDQILISQEKIRFFYPRHDNFYFNADHLNNYLNEYDPPSGDPDEKWGVPGLGKDAKGQPMHLNIAKMFEQKYRDLRWFHLDDYRLTIGIKTSTLKQSRVFFGDKYCESIRDEKQSKKRLQNYLKRRKYKDVLPEHYQDITEPLWIACRYHWITEECLYGQDNQFNIYRSFCFLSPFQEVVDNATFGEKMNKFLTLLLSDRMKRLPIGLLCLVLQVFLTVGIVMEVVNNWNPGIMFEIDNYSDLVVIVISFLVFAFILLIYYDTAEKFYAFYFNMEYVAKISWKIYVLDFISNIVVGFVISWISLFFLLQTQTISDVVLNSFALTFVIELDDIANLFEADEEVLLRNDWHHLADAYVKTDYDSRIRRRVIDIPWKVVLVSTGLIVFSIPLGIIFSLVFICRVLVFMCCKRCGYWKEHNFTQIDRELCVLNKYNTSGDNQSKEINEELGKLIYH